MGRFTLIYSLFLISAVVSACAGTIMTNSNSTGYMSFTQDAVGLSRPSPPTSVILDGDVAYLILRRSSRDIETGTGYVGIGKYALAASPELREQFHRLADVLSSRSVPQPKPARHQNVLRYDFSRKGKRYVGVYDFSLGSEFNSKLKPFGEIRGAVLGQGEPIVGLHPEIRAVAKGSEVSIFLAIANTGKSALEMAGPSSWREGDNDAGPSVTVGISAPDGEGWLYHLDHKHLVGGEGLEDGLIAIAPEGSVTLEFRYPLTVPGGLSGKYTVAARMKADIVSPGEFEGPIETGLDPVLMTY